MREIPSDNAEHKQKRRSVAILCGVVISVVLIVAAVNLGWIDAAGTSKPAVTPAPLASVAVQVSPVPNAEDVLPTNISDLTALASGGNALACIELGDRFRYGKGCIRDDEEALRWYDKAAVHADQTLEMKLAEVFESWGYHLRAATYYEKAAIRGVAKAQIKMALRNQSPGSIDVTEAYAWYNICAASGDSYAVSMRDKLEQDFPPEIISKGQKRSREILAEIEAKKATK
jgi:TPR repeat protein